MTADEPPREPDPPRPLGRAWPIALVAVALIVLVGYLWTLRTARDVGRSVAEAGEAVGELAQRFKSGTITTTFLAALPELSSTGLGNLELATATMTETLTRTDERRVLWDLVSLGETVAEIQVPVTYRYHVRLGDPWHLEVRDRTCVVQAPRIRPSLPPAIHTDGMRKRTQSGWLRFDATRQLEELERSLTPLLESYAGDPRHLDAVREGCRKTVAAFVRTWLLREDHWRDDRFHAIVVRFADETDAEGFDRPTLSLEE